VVTLSGAARGGMCPGAQALEAYQHFIQTFKKRICQQKFDQARMSRMHIFRQKAVKSPQRPLSRCYSH